MGRRVTPEGWHGMLMKGELVRATYEDRKTKTRRVMSPQPVLHNGVWRWKGTAWDEAWALISDRAPVELCPHGTVGSRIWVRERWGVLYPEYAGQPDEPVFYRADYTQEDLDTQVLPRWRSSRRMPWWASRLALEITSLRVERLQEITEEDARAEGIEAPAALNPKGQRFVPAFADLWDEINAARGYPWESNPWVWVIGYRRLPGTPSKEAARG